MRILITGATGFLGGRLLRSLAGRHEVWAITRRRPEQTWPDGRILIQDLAAESWTAELPSAIDAVVHLAQSPEFRDFPNRAANIYGVSAAATMRLLEWAQRAGARHFVLGSTDGLYGSSGNPVREADPIPDHRSQLGFYFATKRASELLAMQYASQFHVAVLRFFFIYGAGQSERMLLPRLVGSVRAGRSVLLQGEDGIRLNPIHVDDAVRAIERTFDLQESRIFNVAGPQTASLREIANSIGRAVDCPPVFDIDKTVTPAHLVADIGRMTGALGAPSIRLDRGIAELCGSPAP